MEKITLMPEGEQEAVSFYVLEQTVVAGVSYLLVTDTEDGDGDAWILKDLSGQEDEEAVYEFVEDDAELSAIGNIFSQMMEDIDII